MSAEKSEEDMKKKAPEQLDPRGLRQTRRPKQLNDDYRSLPGLSCLPRLRLSQTFTDDSRVPEIVQMARSEGDLGNHNSASPD